MSLIISCPENYSEVHVIIQADSLPTLKRKRVDEDEGLTPLQVHNRMWCVFCLLFRSSYSLILVLSSIARKAEHHMNIVLSKYSHVAIQTEISM